MRDMYEVMDRWGLGPLQITAEWIGNQSRQDLKACYRMVRNHVFNVTMMKGL